MTALGWPERARATDTRFIDTLGGAGSGLLTRVRRLGSAQTLSTATWMIALAGTLLIAILMLRVWLQLVGETDTGGLIGFGYGVSGVLVGPFQSFEPYASTVNSGILEFSTLVALEAYLIATMIALTVLFSMRLAVFATPKIVHRKRIILTREQFLVPLPERPKA